MNLFLNCLHLSEETVSPSSMFVQHLSQLTKTKFATSVFLMDIIFCSASLTMIVHLINKTFVVLEILSKSCVLQIHRSTRWLT